MARKNMNNDKTLTAHLQEQGSVSCCSHERSACLNFKTTEIYTCGVTHKTTEIRGPIIGMMKNRTGKKEQPQAPKTNFYSDLGKHTSPTSY
jgi:hypothetical protein